MDLYYAAPSAPCRAVHLLCAKLQLSPNIKPLNLLEKEQYSDEFLEINPQHTVPLLMDDGFALSESRAILMYLAENYAEDDSLYPKDKQQRAIVNQRLFFDQGTLFERAVQCFFRPVIWLGQGVKQDLLEKVEEAFSILDTYLEGHDWVAGDQITIADYSIVVTVSTLEAIGFDFSAHQNVTNWLQRCKDTMEEYEGINQGGIDILASIYNDRLSQINQETEEGDQE